MTRKYWTHSELKLLYGSFIQNTGRTWSDAVDIAVAAGSTRAVGVTPQQWALISAVVGRAPDQCARRLQTERRMEQERRAALSKADVSYAPGPTFEAPSPVTASHARIDTAGNVSYRYINGCNVSPYLGKAEGRIVLSFNGRGAA